MQTQTQIPQAVYGSVTMYPIVGYRDLGAAIAWLCRVFGFAPLEVIQNEDGSYAHVELRLGDGADDSPWEQQISTQDLYVTLDGIDAHYDRAVTGGAEIDQPLHETSYNSREYSARDREGNLWSFGIYRPAVG